MKQRTKRLPAAHSGVSQFLKRFGGNRRTCAKALKFMPQSDICGDDAELYAVLLAEFGGDIEALRMRSDA